MPVEYTGIVPRRQRKFVRLELGELLNQWCQHWFVDAAAIDVSFGDGLMFKAGSEAQNSQPLAAGLVVNGTGTPLANLAKIASGASEQSDAGFVALLQSKMTGHLLSLFQVEQANPLPTSTGHNLASAVTVHVSVANIGIDFGISLALLHARWPELLVPAKSGITSGQLTDRHMLVNKELVSMVVSLEGTSLSFAEIMQLQAGDILKLTHPLDQPLVANVNHQQVPVKPYLVRNKNQKAIILGG